MSMHMNLPSYNITKCFLSAGWHTYLITMLRIKKCAKPIFCNKFVNLAQTVVILWLLWSGIICIQLLQPFLSNVHFVIHGPHKIHSAHKLKQGLTEVLCALKHHDTDLATD